MGELDDAAASLRTAGLRSTPPHVLLTRWLALLSGEQPTFLDAVRESDTNVPGTRYAFLAVTETSVCYLKAEHDDQFWEHDRVFINDTLERITPRTLVAWRRPLALVTEVGLGGDPWEWLPGGSDEVEASIGSYVLKFGSDSVDIPLQGRRRRCDAPNPSSVITRLTDVWRGASSFGTETKVK
jgi:hypothetical protein